MSAHLGDVEHGLVGLGDEGGGEGRLGARHRPRQLGELAEAWRGSTGCLVCEQVHRWPKWFKTMGYFWNLLLLF